MGKKAIINNRINEYKGNKSLRQIARDIGVNFDTIWNLANNKTVSLGKEVVGKLLVYFDLETIDDLFPVTFIEDDEEMTKE